MRAEYAKWSTPPPVFALPEWIADPPTWQCRNRLAPRSISPASQNKILLKAGDVTQSPETCSCMADSRALTAGKYTCSNRGSFNWNWAAKKGVCQGIWDIPQCWPMSSSTGPHMLLIQTISYIKGLQTDTVLNMSQPLRLSWRSMDGKSWRGQVQVVFLPNLCIAFRHL